MEKKVILVSHGKLSAGMKHSVQMIIGENEQLMSFGMLPGEHPSVVTKPIEEMAKKDPNTQYIIISDLLGGSVCNACMLLMELPNVKLISGLNMGIVIEILLSPSPMSDEEIEEKIIACKNGIVQVNAKYVAKNSDASDDDFF